MRCKVCFKIDGKDEMLALKIGSLDIVETKGQWIFKNIKMRWISMLFPTKSILSKYWALVLKMHKDVGIISLQFGIVL
jgi:hypothetical protein